MRGWRPRCRGSFPLGQQTNNATHPLLQKQKSRRGTDSQAGLWPAWNAAAAAWMAPFVMEAVNSRVVHRSAALARTPYGADFKGELMVGGWQDGRPCLWGRVNQAE